MPDVYVRVYNRGGRWVWQVIKDGIAGRPGPAYETRVQAISAASNRFPEHRIEAEEK